MEPTEQVTLQDYSRDNRYPNTGYALYGKDSEDPKKWTEKKIRHVPNKADPKRSRTRQAAKFEMIKLLLLDIY